MPVLLLPIGVSGHPQAALNRTEPKNRSNFATKPFEFRAEAYSNSARSLFEFRAEGISRPVWPAGVPPAAILLTRPHVHC